LHTFIMMDFQRVFSAISARPPRPRRFQILIFGDGTANLKTRRSQRDAAEDAEKTQKIRLLHAKIQAELCVLT
jgi:hypothetical protein